jgi:hypothetical protein
MTKLSAYALAATLALVTTAMLANSNRAIPPDPNSETSLDADGAFRDGLYLGKLAAASGQPMRIAVGRWSTEQDRATFTTGYQRGYGETLASMEP